MIISKRTNYIGLDNDYKTVEDYLLDIDADLATLFLFSRGNIGGTNLDTGIIENENIADGTIIASEKVKSLTIEAGQIAAASITTSKLGAGAVTTTKITAGAVTAGEIATNVINATHMASNSINTDSLQADAVTASKISADAVNTTNLAAGAVTASKINVTELSAVSANLGSIVSGTITAATLQTASSGTRVTIDTDGLRGHNTSFGQVFNLPTDGSAPTFASGQIQNATIIDTTIISNDFKTSGELPHIAINDSGLSLEESIAAGKYGSGVKYGAGSIYGTGIAFYVGNTDRPVVSVEKERTLSDIRYFNRSAHSSGASVIGDTEVKSGNLYLCTGAGTPGTFTQLLKTGDVTAGATIELDNLGTVAVSESLISDADNTDDLGSAAKEWKDLYIDGTANIDSLVADTADINAGTVDATIGGTTPAVGTFTTLSVTEGKITFPATQSASADAHTLDDYEEGTWTMGVSFGGGTTGITYANNTGSYLKVGGLVTVTGYLGISNKGSSSGAAQITGLPFTSLNNLSFLSAISVNTFKISFADALMGHVVENQTYIGLYESTNAGVQTTIDNTNFSNDTWIIVMASYMAA